MLTTAAAAHRLGGHLHPSHDAPNHPPLSLTPARPAPPTRRCHGLSSLDVMHQLRASLPVLASLNMHD